MNTLAIDTSTDSLGLALEVGETLYVRVCREGLKHAQTLAPQVKQLCEQGELAVSDLDLLVVAVGPGSFTGLRIGIATAKGLAKGSGASVVGVCTLDAYARRNPASVVVPLIDARKQRVYAAFYRNGSRSGDLLDVPPERIVDMLRKAASQHTEEPTILTGPYAGTFWKRFGNDLDGVSVDPSHELCDPYLLLRLGIEIHGTTGPDPDLSPLYLRLSEAEEKRRDRSSHGGPDAVGTDR